MSETEPYVDFVTRAEAAEARQDWDRAAMWWYYAARTPQAAVIVSRTGCWPSAATIYNQREDAAKEKARRQRAS